ncbi:MAG TPA: flagellar biosynthetic protein FliR [Thermomicrobiales bacterium]|nr:flagellar biosynthetic protein FliR [Thermomicrobiales bacterium]
MDLTPVLRFALLLVRPGVVVMLAPGLGGRQIPAMAKIALTVMAAVALMPTVQLPETVGSNLVLIILREAAVGLSLAFVLQVLIAGAEFAGHLSSYQIGFSYGATIDPISGVRSTMLVSLYGMLATLVFLGVNGHHALLRALAASYDGVPIGVVQVNGSLVSAVRDMLAMVFTVGLRLAAPVLIVLLIVEMAVGLISRAAPSLSFMVIGYPIRIVVGLFLVAALIATVPGVIESMIERTLMLGGRTATAFR